MSTYFWRIAVALVIAVVLPSCVSGSGTGSPRLREKRLIHVTLDSVTPRELSLVIADTRVPLPANSDSMVAHIDLAMRSVLAGAGIEVRANSVNTLTVQVGYPDQPVGGHKPEDCIAIRGRLRLEQHGVVSSMGESCFGLRNIYGMRIANDSKGVYETAVSGMFEGLDKAFDGVTLH